MAKNKGGNWEEQILREISQRRRKTYLGQKHPSLKAHEHPNFKVYEFTANRAIDGDKRDLIAGPEWSIMLQSSLLKAEHDMLGRRLGFAIDFEEWFKAFEYEFMKAFPASKQPSGSKLKPWGVEPENRPKKLNLLTKDEAAKRGYMIIRFWKDRKLENNSIILAGTYTELREQLLQQMRTITADVQVYGMPTIAYQETHRFVPQILLYFIEDLEDVEEGWSPVNGFVKTKVIGENSDTITEAKAKSLANKIKSEFAANNGYVWRKGKVICSYKDLDAGLQTWGPFRDKADAQALYTKVLSLQGKTFQASKMNFKENANASEAYPIVPPTKRIYGEQRKLPRKFPIADVRFVRAELHIWGRPKPVILIDRSGRSKDALVAASNYNQP
jgi:hypothetical protein